MKTQLIPGCLLFLLLSATLLTSGCSSSDSGQGQNPADTERRVPVETLRLEPVDLTETFTLPAKLQPVEDISLAAEVAGRILRLHVAEGDQVVAGQPLLAIDADMLRAQLEREEQNVRVLTSRRDRLRRLHEEGLVSRQDIDDADNALTTAKAALRQARLQFEKSTPTAPLTGFVDRLHVEAGEYVDPGKPLLRLVQVDRLKAEADVPEKDVTFLHEGQSVTLVPAEIQGYDLQEVAAVIDHIALVADEVSRTYRTTLIVADPPPSLRSGMIVRVTFVRQQHEQVIAVPLPAVLDRRGKKLVYVVEDGKAREIEVVTGRSVGSQVLIRFGLSPGQQLVIKGQQLLIDGALVRNGSN